MAHAAKFLHPIRASLSAFLSPCFPFSHSRIPFTGDFGPIRTLIKGLKPVIHRRATISDWKLCIQRNHLRYFSQQGLKFSAGIFCASVAFGSFSLWPCTAHAMNGSGNSVDNHHVGLGSEEDPHTFLQSVRKLLLPVFLVLTVLINWDHPIILVTKLILVLFGTKPSPYSVYLFLEQLRRKSMHHQPLLYKFKSQYAKKVEVEDYTLLCLARVELKDQKLNLIGILGSWWVLPPSSCWEESSEE